MVALLNTFVLSCVVLSIVCVFSLCCRGLVYRLCLLLVLPWVGLSSVSSPCVAVGWSIVCVFSLCCRGLVYRLCLFLVLPWVGLSSVSSPCVAVGWSIVCVFSLCCRGLVYRLCLLLVLPWVGLWFVIVAFPVFCRYVKYSTYQCASPSVI